jgi:hydrogenase small subunit
MTGVITYMLAFDRLPPLDRQGRPAMFYGQRLHDKCYRRPHFDAGQFVEKFDEWNGGLSWPVKSGHGCLGCAEDNFWDKGSFYSPVTNLGVTGNVESTADSIGGAIAGAAAIGVAAHAVVSGIAKATGKKKPQASEEVSNG